MKLQGNVILIAGVVFVLIVILRVTVKWRGAEAQAEPTGSAQATSAPRAVATAVVEVRPMVRTADVTGTVVAVQRAEMAPKIMGKVAAVYVQEGDRVEKGQLLLKIEAADLAARVARADALVETGRAGVAQAQTAFETQVTQSATRVEQARAALQTAREQLAIIEEITMWKKAILGLLLGGLAGFVVSQASGALGGG